MKKVITKNLNYLILEKPYQEHLSLIGTKQLPKPPIKTGITIKKIIIKACAVIITLYN